MRTKPRVFEDDLRDGKTGKTDYDKIRQRRLIPNSKVRTELIQKLMDADEMLATPTRPKWLFKQWDSLELKYLRWAWNIWAKNVYVLK